MVIANCLSTQVVCLVVCFLCADCPVVKDPALLPGAVSRAVLCSINHLVSQSDVLMFLNKHVEEMGPLADVTLQQLGLATKPVVCVPAEMATIKAFATMVVGHGTLGAGSVQSLVATAAAAGGSLMCTGGWLNKAVFVCILACMQHTLQRIASGTGCPCLRLTHLLAPVCYSQHQPFAVAACLSPAGQQRVLCRCDQPQPGWWLSSKPQQQ